MTKTDQITDIVQAMIEGGALLSKRERLVSIEINEVSVYNARLPIKLTVEQSDSIVFSFKFYTLPDLLFDEAALRAAYGDEIVCSNCGDKLKGDEKLSFGDTYCENGCLFKRMPRYIFIFHKAGDLALEGKPYIKYLWENLPKKEGE